MYDQTLNAIYEQALQNDGTNARASGTFTSDDGGRAGVSGRAQHGRRVPSPNTAWTVDPDFKVARSWQNNIQFEHGLSDRYSVSVGAAYVKGYDLPVVNNINLINPDRHDDGRPADLRDVKRRNSSRPAL